MRIPRSLRHRVAHAITALPVPETHELAVDLLFDMTLEPSPFTTLSLTGVVAIPMLQAVGIEAVSDAIDLEFPPVTSGENRHQQLPNSVISSDLLFEPSVPFELPLPPFSEPTIVEALQDLDKPISLDFTAWLVLNTEIGENWHEPLHVNRTPQGKIYQEQDSIEPLATASATMAENVREGGRRNVQITRTARGRAIEALTIWDLILPILEPPPDAQTQRFIFWPGDLYPYQREGVQFLIERTVALLADDMGTGKTIQSVVALQLLIKHGLATTALVICPANVIRQWDRELEQWSTLRPAVVTGPAETRQLYWEHPAHVWITSYETLRNDLQDGRLGKSDRFDVVIADEVHRIKNPGAQISQAVRQLQARYRWGLSGTPIENRLEDLHAIFEFLQPGLLRCQGMKPQEARALIGPYFLRRRLRDVITELPDLLVRDQWLDLSGRQLERYQVLEERGVSELRGMKHVTVPHILTLLLRLKQLCNFDPDSGESAKYDWLRDVVAERAANGDKLLIFSQFRETYGVDHLSRLLTAEGYQTALYTPDLTPSTRDRLVRTFNESPDYHAFLSTPRAGGVGLNIQAANYVVLFDHWWNPAMTQQAIGRCWRIGQTQKVFVYHLWTENTVKQRIYDILERKRLLYEEVIDSQSNIEGHGLSEEELFELFGLEHPARTEANERLDHLSAQEFERLVAQLFERSGYTVAVTGRSGDGGADVIGMKRTGFGTEKIAVQCKRWRQDRLVGQEIAQHLLGRLHDDPSFSKGILVTTSAFTRPCLQFCRRHGNLECWDRMRLLYLLRQAKLL